MNNAPANILLITTHDSGRHFGCYGHPTVHTPAVDALAAEGCRLTNFFAGSPICSPSRACLFTGTYPQTHGVMTIANRAKGIALRSPQHHLAHLLKQTGHRTALFNHQHETAGEELLGFDDLHLRRPRAPADVVGREVAGYLRQVSTPFFVEVGLNETHTPYDNSNTVADDSLGVEIPPYILDNAAARAWMAGYQGMARRADEGIRYMLEGLAQAGLAESTLVIFTVDHGIELPRAKWFLYDPGLAVAFVCRWPNGGIRPGSTCDLLTSNVDVLPTVMELLGLPRPVHAQGVSFAAALRGESTAPMRSEVFGFQTGYEMRCVRTDRYKLIHNFERHPPCTCPGDVAKPRQEQPCSPLVELYDLRDDPCETLNRAEDTGLSAVRRDLTGRLRRWMRDQNDPILQASLCPDAFYQEAVALLMHDVVG